MKKYVAALGSLMFFVICVSLYLMLEAVNTSNTANKYLDEHMLNNIEVKIKDIESDLKSNQASINDIKKTLGEIAAGSQDIGKVRGALKRWEQEQNNLISRKAKGSILKPFPINSNVCNFSCIQPQKPDIQMLDVVEELRFDNPDGGSWKQGFPIYYDISTFQKRKLQVFVVPHSHCDPGWLKTFENYYNDQTRNVFNNMVAKLEEHKKMKFIYAEMSFFSLWWNEIGMEKKQKVKQFIQEGRLEIVTGGWVMTDEANAHYFAMLDQMIEGNHWLFNELGVKSRNGWAIDPFGYSPTMAYILKGVGLENMLIQRTHYAVKKKLSKEKKLEFKWRQNWDHEGLTDMFCHMMPFYSYDVPHTCGPDPAVCCQFDFRRLAGGKITCPWRKAPVAITSGNVKERAEILLEQYRQKSELYKSNVLLIPLGDDFRYDTPLEWDQQYKNYIQLFEFMNAQPDLHVQAQFGTLSDYFNALHEEMKVTNQQFPVLSGDFFTYADRDDHYWSGYFTSRPFQKRFDRIVEAELRDAEVIFSQALALSKKDGVTAFPVERMLKHLTTARRALGLFQHHDGITGTAKDFVVNDYGQKLLNGLNGLKRIIQNSAQLLLMSNPPDFSPDVLLFNLDKTFANHDALPENTRILLTEKSQLVGFYNSLGHSRRSVIRLYTDTPNVKVVNAEGEVLLTQADPYWIDSAAKMSSTVFKILFVVDVPALGISKYTIQKDLNNPKNSLSTVNIYNVYDGMKSDGTFTVRTDSKEDITLENSDISVHIPLSKGTMESIELKEDGHKIASKVAFKTYGTVRNKDKSGAYLFLPDGPAQEIYFTAPIMRYIQGPLVSEVHSMFQHVEHITRIHNSLGIDSLSVDIYNIVDIRSESNKEIVMRVETSINNEDREFFTDLNGFQMQRRKAYDKIPLQGNFYPMPTAAYIEDTTHRFTILSAQSLGMASLKTGWLEIVQDRRLMQDDNRGLAQGVTDNRRTPNKFRFLVEKRTQLDKIPPKQPSGYLSLLAHLASQEFIHPIHVLPQSHEMKVINTKDNYKPLKGNLPCDIHLVNWKILQENNNKGDLSSSQLFNGLIFHRYGIDCSFPSRSSSCEVSSGKIRMNELLADLKIENIYSTSLNLLDTHEAVSNAEIIIKPMEIQAYKMIMK